MATARTGVVLSTLALAGCLDIENSVRFETDNGAVITARLVFDKEAEDLVGFFEHLVRFSPNPEAAALGAGLCASVSLANPTLPPGLQLTSRQFMNDNQLVCEVRLRVREIPREVANAADLDVLTIEDDPALRQKTIRLDFEKLPDVSPVIMVMLAEKLKETPEFAGKVSNRDLFDIMDKMKKAFSAFVAMSMRNRYVEVAVAGARVIETDGEVAADGRSAKLRMTYSRLCDILLKPEARRGAKFFAKVGY